MPQPSTEKGARQVELILDAARRSIATRGYAATSLARVADEAGISKRMVLYYFDTREQLISELVRRITDEMIATAAGALEELDDPREVVVEGFQRVWARVTQDETLVAAYLSVLTEAMSDPALADVIRHVREAYAELAARVVDLALSAGLVPRTDIAAFEVHVFAGFRGLLLEYFERGSSPALDGAARLYEQGLVTAFAPAPVPAD